MSKHPALALILTILITSACVGLPPAQTTPPTPAPALPTAAITTTPAKSGTLRLSTVVGADVRDVPYLMALDALRAQGYTVESIELADSTLNAAALAGGDVDIASFNNQTAWAAVVKGASIRTIMQRYVTSPLVSSRQEIKTCADLGGKSLALSNTKGVTPALLDLYLKQNCPGTEPQFVVIGDSKARAAALLSGAADAAVLEVGDIMELERMAPGRFHTLVALGQVFPQVQSSGIHVRRDWALQNPELLKDFIRALLHANRQVTEDPEVLYAESVKRLGLELAVAREIGGVYLGYKTWHANGGLTPENIQYTINFLTDISALPSGLKVEDVADLSYLNAVLDEIGRK